MLACAVFCEEGAAAEDHPPDRELRSRGLHRWPYRIRKSSQAQGPVYYFMPDILQARVM